MGKVDHRTKALIVGWILLLAVVVAAYWPGLNGPFVLDDFGSLAALGSRGGVIDWETFKAFVFGGNSGPTGRPISLLSFLIDARDWPAESGSFKRTNLIIHLLCGIALGAMIHCILGILKFDRCDSRWLVFAACGLWLLHPFLVSTTLYVVQRMAQLSTLFVLVGLTVYLRGRVQVRIDPRRAYFLMTAGIGLFGLLAVFSKENGILLPLLVVALELTVVASRQQELGRLNRIWNVGFLVVPSAAVFVYLGERAFSASFFEVVPPRDFSIYERVLTQPRILVDYLQHWFIPKLYTTGVFQDHFLKSTGILTPITTALSAVLHLGVFVLAFMKRRQWPLFALAVLFFYVSHLLESTVLNLELYFEHRNYLATGLLFLPLLVALRRRVSLLHFVLVSTCLMLLLGGFTRYSSSIWASFPSMVEASAQKAPTSARAQGQLSVLLFNAGRREESLHVLDRALKNSLVDSPLLSVNRLIVLCSMGRLRRSEFDAVAAELARTPYDTRLIRVYTTFSDEVIAGNCPAIDVANLSTLFQGMLQLPFNAERTSLQYSQIQYFVGLTSAFLGRRAESVLAFEESLSARPGASHAMLMAAVLATNSFHLDALRFSDIALTQLELAPRARLTGGSVAVSDIKEFQQTVRSDLEQLQDPDTSGPDG